MQTCGDFTALTPDVMLDAVEAAMDVRLAGFAHPHHSYINRVYELETTDRERIIAKFYRPGRWSRDALQDEHDFLLECAAEEIPVVPPRHLVGGTTLGTVEGIHFAVFDKKRGREFEATCDEDWRRLGRIIARMHVVGARHPAPARVVMHPDYSTADDVAMLLGGDVVPQAQHRDFEAVVREIQAAIGPPFESVDLTRIHGDCHCQNILERPGEGLMMIDFDDMVMGPIVQDLWMLLPEHLNDSRREINLILEGYELFREFDDRILKLIEPLRAMRMLYFLAWCAKQRVDPNFSSKFPDWGNDAFWRQQIGDLRRQLRTIETHA